MKKTAVALTLVLVMFASAVTEPPFIRVANANFVPAAMVVINAPANETYNSNVLILNYTVYFTLTENQLVVYSIDGADNVTVLNKHSSQFYVIVSEQATLPELPDGSHRLDVYAVYAAGKGASDHAQVYFAIDATPPTVSKLSVENKTYPPADIPLNFTVSEVASQISYSIDKQANKTISGNTTLTDLAEGSHSITVYANDAAGNIGASETVTFTVAKPESFPTLLIAAAIVVFALAFASAGLVYYNNRKRQASGST